jgi:hypothetical protein
MGYKLSKALQKSDPRTQASCSPLLDRGRQGRLRIEASCGRPKLGKGPKELSGAAAHTSIYNQRDDVARWLQQQRARSC